MIWRYSQATVFDCQKDAIPASRSPAHGLLGIGRRAEVENPQDHLCTIFAIAKYEGFQHPFWSTLWNGRMCAESGVFTVLSAILPVWIRLPAKVANCTSNIQSALQHPPSNDKACNPGGGARALPRPMPRPRKGPWENQKWIELKGTKQEIVRPSNRKDYRLS